MSTKAQLQRTLDSNEAVHILVDFIRQGSYYVPGVMELLVNAGTRTKDGVVLANEQMTIPYEILPGYGTPGSRKYINEKGEEESMHDKPDIVSITGWKTGDPTPPDPSKVTIFIVEHCYANAVTRGLVDAVRFKWARYSMLAKLLSELGFNVILQASSSTMVKTPVGVSAHDYQLFHDTQTAIEKTIVNRSIRGPTGALSDFSAADYDGRYALHVPVFAMDIHGCVTADNLSLLRRLGITGKLADELWKKLNTHTAKTLANSIGAFKHDLAGVG